MQPQHLSSIWTESRKYQPRAIGRNHYRTSMVTHKSKGGLFRRRNKSAHHMQSSRYLSEMNHYQGYARTQQYRQRTPKNPLPAFPARRNGRWNPRFRSALGNPLQLQLQIMDSLKALVGVFCQA